MKAVRVTIEITPNEGNAVCDTYEMDPKQFNARFAYDSNSGFPALALAGGMPMEAVLHAHGWLELCGVVKAKTGA